METSRFCEIVDQVSDFILSLLKLFETSDLSLINCLDGLDDDLLALANAIVSLSRQIKIASDDGDYDPEEDPDIFYTITLLVNLMENLRPCIQSLERKLINVLRSQWASPEEYIQSTNIGEELQHLRMRITIYKTATSIPVMIFNTHPLFSQINLPSTTLASRTIQHTLSRLSHDIQRLTIDPQASQTLDHERIELINILTPFQHHLQTLLSQQPTSTSNSSIPHHYLPTPLHTSQTNTSQIPIRGRNRPVLSLSRSRSLPNNHNNNRTTNPNFPNPNTHANLIPFPDSIFANLTPFPYSTHPTYHNLPSIPPPLPIPSFIHPPPAPNPSLGYTQSFPTFTISMVDLQHDREPQSPQEEDLSRLANSMIGLDIPGFTGGGETSQGQGRRKHSSSAGGGVGRRRRWMG